MKFTDRGGKYPVTPGHEIVGTVSDVGGSVQKISVGDEVLVYPWIGCLDKCPACRLAQRGDGQDENQRSDKPVGPEIGQDIRRA